MNASELLFGTEDPHPSYLLQELHLYNWGAFHGWHMASVDPRNTAIVGPTGSGKTTVVDALMTLLSSNPKYNLASTGGHESDRDLVSYVRGVSGPGTEGSSEHISRNGKTITGIAARMVRSEADQVWLGALFWFDGSSSAVTDLNRRWLFSHNGDQSLNLWLEEHHRGGAKALSRLAKETDGLQIFPSKSSYLAKLQSHFEVGSNAFTLLNRAAGLKQLNSIDEIFRELVLEDQAAFDDALKVADDFDELTSIHVELETARRQHLSLLPLRELDRRFVLQSEAQARVTALHALLPAWFAQQGQVLWGARIETLQSRLEQLQALKVQAEAAVQAANAREQECYARYQQMGGSDIESLKRLVAAAEKLLGARQHKAQELLKLLRSLSFGTTDMVTQSLLQQHQAQAGQTIARMDEQIVSHASALEAAIAQEHNARAEVAQLEQALEQTRKRPGSNIPSQFQKFRADLCDQLNLPTDELPFVAELLEVQKQHGGWRGAIERALGSQRLRILVPATAMRSALHWVNQRHNQLHVRLLEVRPGDSAAGFRDDGFCRRLNIKPHRYEPALRNLLQAQDRQCVDSAEALQRTPHGLTQQGLMSGKNGYFEKQDQKPLSADWMTGFDNRDRLEMLQTQLAEAQIRLQESERQKSAAQSQQSRLQMTRSLCERLCELQYEEVDVIGARQGLQLEQERLQALLHPQSDTARARLAWEAARGETESQREAQQRWASEMAVVGYDHDQAAKQQQSYRQRAAAVPLPQLAAQDAHFGAFLPLTCVNLVDREREAGIAFQQQLATESDALGKLRSAIARQMTLAKEANRGYLTDEPAELDSIASYLARLRVLEEEALPEKSQRFQMYLNKSSEEGVNNLLSGISGQITEIRERIDALNQTLRKVDFQGGRYLQLQSQEVSYPELKALNGLIAELRSVRLRDDHGERHYMVLNEIVDLLRRHATNRRTKAAQALLDARYRLQFSVLVHDRASDQILERRTGSQGGSGGEKEIIASYVLTASLSYALCPGGRSRPVFGTIVLDEAFSKSSQAVAGRIIEALREFGLHALFVTPNKEMRLLRNHTRSAVVVHRRGQQSSLTSISWEALDRSRPGSRTAPVAGGGQ